MPQEQRQAARDQFHGGSKTKKKTKKELGREPPPPPPPSATSTTMNQLEFGIGERVSFDTNPLTLQALGSLPRKPGPDHNGGVRSYQKLSTFRPMYGQQADLFREPIQDITTTSGPTSAGPTYETIDPHHLSHLNYGADYCAATGSGCSTASSLSRSTAAAIQTILPDVGAYGTTTGCHHQQQPLSPVRHQHPGHQPGGIHQRPDLHEPLYASTGPISYGEISWLSIIISTSLHLAMITANLVVTFCLYMEGNPWWFGFSAAFTVLPLVVLNACSAKWYIHRNREAPQTKSASAFTIMKIVLSHIFLLGPISRFSHLIRYNWRIRSIKNSDKSKKFTREWQMNDLQSVKSRLPPIQHPNDLSKTRNEPTYGTSKETDYNLLSIQEDADVSILLMQQGFMQSIPMAILQLYILAIKGHQPSFYHYHTTKYAQWTCTCVGLTGLAWSLASYNRAVRRFVVEKREMGPMGVSFYFLWRFFTIGSRILAIGLFAAEYGYWIFPVAIGHWGIMSVWVMHQDTRFCDTEQGKPRPCHEYFFNMLIGAVYIFCFLNVKDEPTRYKYLAFYIIVFLENATLGTLWYVKSPQDIFTLPTYLVILFGFALGIVFMLLYYRFFHPNGKPFWINRAAKCC